MSWRIGGRVCDAAFVFFLLTLASAPASAYLDPGTGSMLLSVFVGLASSAYFFVRRLPSLLRAGLFRMRADKGARVRHGLVFYGESKAYWGTFEPILRALERRGVSVTYLTSAQDDPAFEAGFRHVAVRYVGEGNAAYTALGFLEADVFVLTTPGVDVLQIRRSKGVKRYVHVVHAAADIHSYKLFSFDYYDEVFCSGEHQRRSLRALEALRGTTPKSLPLLGCPYLDRLVEKRGRYRAEPEAGVVLVAPTWGRNGLLARTGPLVPARLAEAGYTVLLRPHPQSFISDKALMEELEEVLRVYPNVVWDRNPDGFESLSRAEVMISDFSGVVFDFAFVFERPVITIGDGPQKEGFEAWDLEHEAWESGLLPKLGAHLRAGEESRLLDCVSALIGERTRWSETIREIRRRDIVNFGTAGEAVAQALIERIGAFERASKAGER